MFFGTLSCIIGDFIFVLKAMDNAKFTRGELHGTGVKLRNFLVYLVVLILQRAFSKLLLLRSFSDSVLHRNMKESAKPLRPLLLLG